MKQHDLHQIFEIGVEQASRQNKAVLVSFVSRININNPIHFYHAGEKDFSGQRFFWTDAQRNWTYVGLGRAISYQSSSTQSRYEEIEKQWANITSNSIVDKSFPSTTGPLLFGGFSFDPLKPKTKLWSEFPDALFVVPQIMLSMTNHESWLTFNAMVSPGEDTKEMIRILESSQHELLNHILQQENQESHTKPTFLKEDIVPTEWMASVEKASSNIREGQYDKVVLARELRLFASDKLRIQETLEKLLDQQKESFIFAFESEADCFIGATPERLIKKEGEQFLSTCLAGSIARGKTDEEDEKLGDELLSDQKNLHEHELVVRMITDAMRNVCHSVEAPNKPKLHKARDIQHLFTPVTGQALKEASIFQAVEHLHPTPALGGYPQNKALEAIREMEQLDRGWYAAPIGWVNTEGNGEFVVAIRSALIQGKEASLFAGCGIVGGSKPLSEYEETKLKFRPMLSALGASEKE